MESLLIKNGNTILKDKIVKSSVFVKDGVIKDIDFNEEIPDNCVEIDADGMYVSPGFIDIHLHGGGGYDFMDCTPEALEGISHIHLQNGTTTMVPTTVTCEFEKIV